MRKTVFALAVVILVSGCHWFHRSSDMSMEPPTTTGPTIINIGGNGPTFSPATVTVRQGSVVYWRNNDRMSHRIVIDQRFDTSDIAPGRLGCGLIANDLGTHTYHDFSNPSMTGTITVTQ